MGRVIGPGVKNRGWFYIYQYQQYSFVGIALGGRVRIPVIKDGNGDITHVYSYYIISQNQYRFGSVDIANIGDGGRFALELLSTIYGVLNFPSSGFISGFTYGNLHVSAAQDAIGVNNLYASLGFIEGRVRLHTHVGACEAMVKNGRLYPIISTYDSDNEDHITLAPLYLNGDNDVSDLQDMLDRSNRFFAYTEADLQATWSPIENILNLKVPMETVAKIGYVPPQEIGQGITVPGPYYEVTL